MFRLVPPLFFIQSQNDSITLESFSSIIFGEFFCDFSNAIMYKNCRRVFKILEKGKILDLGSS